MNPYEILEVANDASEAEIKRAYRKKSLENHPDVGGDRTAFQVIQEAKEILLDPDRRQRFDETGETIDVDQEAVAEIVRHVGEAFTQSSGAVEYIRSQVKTTLEACKRASAEKKRKISNQSRRLARFREKNAGSQSPIVVGIGKEMDRILACEQSQLEFAEKGIAVMERAIGMLKDLRDENDFSDVFKSFDLETFRARQRSPMSASWPPNPGFSDID